MKLDQPHNSALAANIRGFMAARNLSYSTVGDVLKVNGNTVWRYAEPKRNGGAIADSTAKKMARGMGVQVETLITKKIDWKAQEASRGNGTRTAAPARSAANEPRNTDPGSFLIDLPQGIRISIPKGLGVSILSESHVRIER